MINRDDVHRTDLGGPQWDEDDFEEPTEEEEADGEVADETDDEADDEAAVAAAPVQAATVKKEPKAAKPLTTEEARLKVKGAVINWLLETAGQKAAVEPG